MADVNPSATAAAADATRHTNATMIHLWQDNAARLVKANERVMHGMMSALKLEIELGQQLVEHRINTFKEATQSGKPTTAGQTFIDASLQEMDRLTVTIREVSAEMRRSLGDATKIIFNHQDENLHAAVEASPPVQAAKFVAKVKPETALVKTESET